eukprot:11182606-Lingulodinium_polyedra.AAC.1
MASGVVAGLWCGTPCNSWSRARRGPPGGGRAPVRSSQHLRGAPGLSERDVAKVLVGNRAARATVRLLQRAARHNIPS